MPQREALEFEGLPPYDVLRQFYKEFGVGESAIERFEATMSGGPRPPRDAAEKLIPLVEFARCSPGLAVALGTSIDLTAGAILRDGSDEQKRRWAPDLLTLRKVGAWAITEPESGSDAFGGMRSSARPVDGGWVLNGSKTYISNGPYADTLVFICKLDDGSDTPSRQRPIMTFVLDSGMPGLVQSKPLRKMGQHSSPTGELHLENVQVREGRLLKATSAECREGIGQLGREFYVRHGAGQHRGDRVAASSSAVCSCLSPMPATVCSSAGRSVTISLSSSNWPKWKWRGSIPNTCCCSTWRWPTPACDRRWPRRRPSNSMWPKRQWTLRARRCRCSAAMATWRRTHVEQLYRDAKVLQIYGGTDEIQVRTIARDLLSRT